MTDVALIDSLDHFDALNLAFDGMAKRVWGVSHGPTIVVMLGTSSITPQVINFARMIKDAGFTVWMLSLFGADSRTETAEVGAANLP